ncbi:hypothetical protein D3C78_1301940 [compost metagenome]
MKNQEKNILASDLFGPDATAYSKELAEDVSMRKPRSTQDKIMYYTMIPWIALTWVFFIYMITGFFSKWFGGELEYTQISSASLLLIAALSIVLVELVIRYLGPGSRRNTSAEEEQQQLLPRKFDIKALGIYIGIAVAVVAVGLLLTQIMPSFTVSPWDSLIIFVIGILGQKFIFGRNKSKSK